MTEANLQYLTLATMGISLAVIVAMEIMLQAGWLFILASVLPVLIGMIYVWRKIRTAQSGSKTFWAMLLTSLMFFVGATGGLIDVVREGRHWADFLYLIFPFVMGSYLLWFALRIRKRIAR